MSLIQWTGLTLDMTSQVKSGAVAATAGATCTVSAVVVHLGTEAGNAQSTGSVSAIRDRIAADSATASAMETATALRQGDASVISTGGGTLTATAVADHVGAVAMLASSALSTAYLVERIAADVTYSGAAETVAGIHVELATVATGAAAAETVSATNVATPPAPLPTPASGVAGGFSHKRAGISFVREGAVNLTLRARLLIVALCVENERQDVQSPPPVLPRVPRALKRLPAIHRGEWRAQLSRSSFETSAIAMQQPAAVHAVSLSMLQGSALGCCALALQCEPPRTVIEVPLIDLSRTREDETPAKIPSPNRKRRVLSPLFVRASRRALLQRVRRNAPRHPVGPEAQMRLAVERLFRAYHDEIVRRVVAHAPGYLRRQRRDSRADLPDAGDHAMRSVFADLFTHGKSLARSPGFKKTIRDNAKRTAESARTQVAKAVGEKDNAFEVDLSDEIDELADGIYDTVGDRMADSLVRASDILEDWAVLDPARSERAGDADALAGMLDTGLDGILGTALQGVALGFGYAWASMNQSAQEAAGVGTYVWLSQHDSAVRPEHRALDEQSCSWDDPPLSAEDSSIGEPCHAGEDVNCRCVASPVPPEDDTGLLN